MNAIKMKNTTVFIPQEPMKRDFETGEFRAMYDLTPARNFGDLETLFPSGPIPLDTDFVIEVMMQKLRNYTDNDYIMCIGDPTLISIATVCAAKINNFKVSLLRYSKKERFYIPTKWSVF